MKLDYLIAACIGFSGMCYSAEPALRDSTNVASQAEKYKVSYKLEDLCDTSVSEREIKIHVYVEPSDVLWDYHEHKDEIFRYVNSFFKKLKINSIIDYSETPLKKIDASNEFGVEVLDSNKKLTERYLGLCLAKDDPEIKNIEEKTSNQKGYSAAKYGLALINGGWEEFRSMPRNEVEEQFDGVYKGMTVKEYILRQNANNIVHEILHCMGLFHPVDLGYAVVKRSEGDTPNIMSLQLPNFSKDLPLGADLDSFQEKLIHSFITRKNAYSAFSDSGKDIKTFLRNIAKSNDLYFDEK